MKYLILLLLFVGCSSQQKSKITNSPHENDFIEIREQDKYSGKELPNPPDSPGFKYSKYESITLEDLIERGEIEENTKGMKIFNSRNKLLIKLTAYPTQDLSQEEEGRRNTFALLFQNMKPIIHIYDSKLKLRYKDQNFLIIFQSQLIPYMKSELKIGDLIGLYIVHATYDEFGKIHIILVNEFHKY
ncbi:MAG: hypothetical protein O9264_01805 [Leptospira sp.]|jgi:hypothetical protein|nr:hypothetical protein [Leptospira sp.]